MNKVDQEAYMQSLMAMINRKYPIETNVMCGVTGVMQDVVDLDVYKPTRSSGYVLHTLECGCVWVWFENSIGGDGYRDYCTDEEGS